MVIIISVLHKSKKNKSKATLFIHGYTYLKLQACGAVYMKQIQIQMEQKFVKNPNWWEADQLAIYQAWRS